jgi:hypothetical protein
MKMTTEEEEMTVERMEKKIVPYKIIPVKEWDIDSSVVDVTPEKFIFTLSKIGASNKKIILKKCDEDDSEDAKYLFWLNGANVFVRTEVPPE